MTKTVNLIFPHQLFRESPLLSNDFDIYLIEEFLFFQIYGFHKQKLAFHRASMKAYQRFLESSGKTVHYIESQNKISDIREFQEEIDKQNISGIHVIDPTDDWLEERIRALNTDVEFHESPLFMNSRDDLQPFFRTDKKSYFQTTFYKQQRKKYNILLDSKGGPEGGQWSYDHDNRKKYPKGKTPPSIQFPDQNDLWEEAVDYINENFEENPGELSSTRYYPVTHEEADDWLDQFLDHRFYDFGTYEDAIVKEENFLNHSMLSPLINVGLLEPEKVVNHSLNYAKKHKIPINSTEGFVRQIIGWREFIRGIYEATGRRSRTRNYWDFKRPIPASFYDGTTGIDPIDQTIKKVLKTGYCHHIERLMVLGNFMLLCEFDPDKVYKWFMELFIDAYDWVMVPNVYGMSQFADGGVFATKPYIGGSNYILKMSNYKKGDWTEVWDGLFWRFIMVHEKTFSNNHRMSVLTHTLYKMDADKREAHLNRAEAFLEKLS